MSTADIIFVILLGFGAIRGYLNGFIIGIFSLLAFVIGIVVALQLTIPVTARYFDDGYFEIAAVVVFIILFVLLNLGVRLCGRLIKNTLHVTPVGFIDNLIGGVMGLIKWAFLISVVFWVLDTVGLSFTENLTDDSVIFSYLVPIAPVVVGWIGDFVPMIEDLIETMRDLTKSNSSILTFYNYKLL